MGDLAYERTSIDEELRRLLAVLPAVLDLRPEDPVRVAWVQWKEALITRIRLLEKNERELQSEPDLWIALSRVEMDAAGFDIDTVRDTRADLR